MSEQSANFPVIGDYGAISEMARSLARTLQAAPAQESRPASALRQRLIVIAQALAAASDRFDSESALQQKGHAHASWYAQGGSLIEQMSAMTAELVSAPPMATQNIGIVFQAFAETLQPGALLALRPAQEYRYSSVEYLQDFQRLQRHLQQDFGFECGEAAAGLPHRFLALRYPQGEQDNVLLSCVLMRALCPDLPEGAGVFDADAFAAWALGPAYFFAFAAWPGNYTSQDARQRLHRVSDWLEALGWREHPRLGPLLGEWRRRIGWDDRERDAGIAALGSGTQAALQAFWQRHLPGVRGYTPDDFDRDAPRLWERLRQLLPPNDLDIDAVESVQPANERSILNAGWSFYLLHRTDLYQILGSRTAEDRYEAKQVLNRLLTKGIELARIARRWSEAREEAPG